MEVIGEDHTGGSQYHLITSIDGCCDDTFRRDADHADS